MPYPGKQLTFLVIFLLLHLSNTFAQNDSSTVFHLDDLYAIVVQNHPLAKQARLLSENAQQQLRLSRGFFDPKISSSYNSKVFKGKDYYSKWKSELKVPVWFAGMDLKAGYERNDGDYLNPEADTDSGNGLAYAGLSLPIGQGLFIDQRRATLRQAEIFQNLAQAEQVKLLNKLFLQVAKDYWQWYYNYHQELLLQNGYQLALFRFEAVRIRVNQGDLASIDSVEALSILQEREINLKRAQVQAKNARILLSNHLWGEEGEPLELSALFTPMEMLDTEFADATLAELYEFANENHPELLKINYKLDQLDIQRRLAREYLKPVLNLNYNFLSRTVDSDKQEINSQFFTENYKFGVDFVFPIFLRKERAKVQQTNIKIDQANLDRFYLNRTVLNEITMQYNEVQNLKELLQLQEDMVSNYQRLLDGEREKFRNGESSVFYVNVREGKLLDTQIKLFKMRFEYAKSLATLRWSAGMGIDG
ncbi:TolC family protein [Flammeovirgaceae bacterium SG7u.111]|nr:TolC family protein [Flammeovirgaceae bacterium SG7u.132]WPO36142.1 TolC family protein [Flammeovirgaceae bacterium SG7u.111]